jgi:hypothetical protein
MPFNHLFPYPLYLTEMPLRFGRRHCTLGNEGFGV